MFLTIFSYETFAYIKSIEVKLSIRKRCHANTDSHMRKPRNSDGS
jgi:hypothetical protein